MKTYLAAAAAAILPLLFAFSIWAEWGPYAWLAAAQLAVLHSYEVQITFIVLGLIFVVPLVYAWHAAGNDRSTLYVILGLPALALAAHFGLMLFFSVTGGTAADCSTFESAVQSAGFLPKRFSMDESALKPLDAARAAGVHSSIGGDTMFVPFQAAAAGGLPVVLQFDAGYSGAPEIHPLEGLIYKAPLPYLVRRDWSSRAPFAVVIKSRQSVRGFWLYQGLFYLLIAAYFGWKWKRSRDLAAEPAKS